MVTARGMATARATRAAPEQLEPEAPAARALARGRPADALAPQRNRQSANREARDAGGAVGRLAGVRRGWKSAAGREPEAPRSTVALGSLPEAARPDRSTRLSAPPRADGAALPGLRRARQHRRKELQGKQRGPRVRQRSAAEIRSLQATQSSRGNAGTKPAGRLANCRPETVPRNGDRRIALQPSVHLINTSREFFVMVDQRRQRSQSPCRQECRQERAEAPAVNPSSRNPWLANSLRYTACQG